LTALAFAVAGISPAVVAAPTPGTSSAANYAWTDGTQENWNWSPQTAIDSTNVGKLQVAWIFPIPPTPAPWTNVAASPPEGDAATPIIYNGEAYIITQYLQVFALNLGNGGVVWSTSLPVLPNMTDFGGGPSTPHLHNGAIALTTNNLQGGPTIWVQTPAYQVFALDALSGKIKFSWQTLEQNAGDHYGVPGNLGHYNTIGNGLLLDQQRGIAITSAIGTSSSASGRGFFRGWDVNQNPPKMIWQTFDSPPQNGTDPAWTIKEVQSMPHAWIFGCKVYPNRPSNPGVVNQQNCGATDLKGLSSGQLNSTLYNDWGYKESAWCSAQLGGQPPGGVGAGWGAPWLLDEHRGVAYVSTNNKNPYSSPCSPGPNLWSVSLLSLDVTTGQLMWGFQTEPHEEWDNDCSFNQALTNQTIGGVQQETITKTCKDGIMYNLNAVTGALNWFWAVPGSIIPQCAYCTPFDPMNKTQMTSDWPVPGEWLNSTTHTQFLQTHSIFEDDLSYDPANNIMSVVGHYWLWPMGWQAINTTDYQKSAGQVYIGKINSNASATAFGVDGATGKLLWSYTVPQPMMYRGGVLSTAGVVYLTLSNGFLVELNEKTGALIQNRLVGGPLNTAPAIGQTLNGTQVLLVPITTAPGETFATYSPPGDIVAYELQPGVAGGGVITTTVTTPGSGGTQTTTVTTQGPSPGASSTGIDPNLFYGIAGLLVVFIIATGALAMRMRRPSA